MPPDNKAKLARLGDAPDTLPLENINYQIQFVQYNKLFNEISEENFYLNEKNRSLRSQLRTKNALDKLIGPSAKNVFRFMCCYSVFVALILILDGFQIYGFNLPETVLNFLVGSTAATVIGLFGMVLMGIFIGARRANALLSIPPTHPMKPD